MNYLAHLLLADATATSYTGSLMGDFYKGSVFNAQIPSELKVGIQLHRQVDSFTDGHEFVLDLKAKMPEYRRYGGIILDILFDHIIARDFDGYHQESLSSFTSKCYSNIVVDEDVMSPRFINVVKHMSEMDWLSDYQHIDAITLVLNRVGQRLRKPVELGRVTHWFVTNEKTDFAGFRQFYNELVVYAQQESTSIAWQLAEN